MFVCALREVAAAAAALVLMRFSLQPLTRRRTLAAVAADNDDCLSAPGKAAFWPRGHMFLCARVGGERANLAAKRVFIEKAKPFADKTRKLQPTTRYKVTTTPTPPTITTNQPTRFIFTQVRPCWLATSDDDNHVEFR